MNDVTVNEKSDITSIINPIAKTSRVILVTGGNGLFGRAIQAVVNGNHNENKISDDKNNDRYIFLDRKEIDLCDYKKTWDIFNKYKPTHIIHLAAFVGGIFRHLRYPVEFWEKNVTMNSNIIQLSKEFKVEKLVSCLSTCIFPDKTTYPIDETMIHNGPPHPSNETYAYAKRMIDIQNHAYAKQYGCKFTNVVPPNIYGPHDNFNLEDSHVVPALIHKFYLAKQNKTDMVVAGSGKPLRQFIYSLDLARLMLWALEHYQEIDPIILCVDEKDEITIADLVQIIAKEIDFKGKIIFDQTKPDGQYKKTASNTKLRKLYPNFKFTTIQTGLKETIQWFIQNYNHIRK